MALTADDWALVRSWIGSKETDEVFQERYDRLGAIDPAIEESMQAQLSAMIFNRDASVTVEDIQVSSAENIKALTKLIDDFKAQGGTDPDDGLGGGMVTTKLARRRWR
jgi:hypothetical protein